MKLAISLFIAVTVWVGASAGAQAQVLQGHLEAEQDKASKPVSFQAELPKLDAAGITEHCRCMDPNRVQVVNRDGQWKLADRDWDLLDFGVREEAAQDALRLIKFYGLNQTCKLSETASSYELHYFLKDGEAPSGPMPGEDAIPLNHSNIKAEQINGSWKVTADNTWVLDFAGNQESARQAAAAINYHGFTHHCFVGKPSRALMYFRK